MLRHLMRLAWNRKRANLLLMVEILLAFFVVFAVAMSGLYLYVQYSRPLGFDTDNLWSVSVTRSDDMDESSWEDNGAATFSMLLDEVSRLPQVELADASNNRPYSNSVTISSWTFEGRDVRSQIGRAGNEFKDVVGLELLAGRWFGPEDEHIDWEPVVINDFLAADLFGTDDPIDRVIRDDDEPDRPGQRVVGVIRAYRHRGDFSPQIPYLFEYNPIDPAGIPVNRLLLKVTPGTTAEFEELLSERLHAVAPDWGFSIQSLELAREDYFRTTLIPLSLLSVLAGFLLLMVVLGLTGVLWQNVTRRTRETGLRRAVGATRRLIHQQIVGEVMVTAALGLTLGIAVVLQLPAFENFSFLPFPLVVGAAILSALFMISLAGGCGLYPGWTATRIQPAEALHYE